jgi:hypothetical protein
LLLLLLLLRLLTRFWRKQLNIDAENWQYTIDNNLWPCFINNVAIGIYAHKQCCGVQEQASSSVIPNT